MPNTVTEFRVFVASPSDVLEERQALSDVIEDLRSCFGDDIALRLKSWERDTFPAIGRPQAVINHQIGQYDIFVGIMWTRFGKPTGQAESGTEEEFNRALTEWKNSNQFPIMFYFCDRGCSPSHDPNQLAKVQAFRSRLAGTGLYGTFITTEDFKNQIRRGLTRILLSEVRRKNHQEVILCSRTERAFETRAHLARATVSIDLLSESPNVVLGPDNRILLEEKLARGCKMRIVMLNTKKVDSNQLRTIGPLYSDHPDRFRADMKKAFAFYKDLRNQAAPGQVELRIWPGPFRFGLLVTDTYIEKNALCRVEMRLLDEHPDNRPNLFFTPGESAPCWFRVFAKQFETIWIDAIPAPD